MSRGRENQPRGFHNPKPVADLVSKLLDPVIERRAGMNMELLASWEDIVGVDFAASTRPLRLDWPRRVDGADKFHPATLVLEASPEKALFVQHDSAKILNRINGFYGFHAIARVKVMRSERPILRTVSKKKKPSPSDESIPTDMRNRLENIEDEALRASLKKMARGIFSEGS